MLPRGATRLPDGAVGALERIGQNELGAAGAKDRLALDGRTGWQKQPHRESERAAEHRVGDAGVAGGRLEDRFSGGQPPRGESGEKHRPHRTVLDAAARVQVLGFGEQTKPRNVRADARELEKGRPAHGVEQADGGRSARSPRCFESLSRRQKCLQNEKARRSVRRADGSSGKDSRESMDRYGLPPGPARSPYNSSWPFHADPSHSVYVGGRPRVWRRKSLID